MVVFNMFFTMNVSLIPKDLPDCLLDDELVKLLLQYFYCANQIIEKMSGGQAQIAAQKAFYDTMGGYLKYYVIPITKYSFYGGLVKFKTIENVISLYEQCKEALNTNGNGWVAPIDNFNDLNAQIDPLRIVVHGNKEETSCSQLDLGNDHTGEQEDMIVKLPRLEGEDRGLLGNIWLPFKRKHTFDLTSKNSAFILLRYFELTTKCYYSEEVSQDSFNKKFKEWILENLEVHLNDDLLYPGLGAILRIMETLQLKTSCIIVDIPKQLKAKRFKTKSYKILENKAKQMSQQSQFPIKGRIEIENTDVFDGDLPTRSSDDDSDKSETVTLESDEASRRLFYIVVSIIVCFILLLLTICFALMIRQMRRQHYSKIEQSPSPSSSKASMRSASKPKKGIIKNIMPCRTNDDEELLLRPEDPSIASASTRRPSAQASKTSMSRKSKDSMTKEEPQRKEKPNGRKKDEEEKTRDKEPETEKETERETEPTDDPDKKSEKKPKKKSMTSSTSSSSSSPPESPKCFTLCSRTSPRKSRDSQDDKRASTDEKKRQKRDSKTS